MTCSMRTAATIAIVAALLAPAHARAQNPPGMRVTGYADRLSVQPGDTIRFMVSSELPTYRVDLVRLVHGDPNPLGPGFKEVAIDAPVNKDYPGRFQPLPSGSYVIVPDAPPLRRSGSFTLQAWIAPTTPGRRIQGIVTKWTPDQGGYGLFLDEDGSLALWIGDKGQVDKARTGRPLRAVPPANVWPGGNQMTNTVNWYFVAASFDSATGNVALYQRPLVNWPADDTAAVVERTMKVKSPAQNSAPLLIAASWDWHDAERTIVGGHFNGKIETPRLFGRALAKEEIDALFAGGPAKDPVAAWDFEADVTTRRVSDVSKNRLHGRTVNMPARAMTGHAWNGSETQFHRARGQYGAIYFHDDDLDDAGWKMDFQYQVPVALKSGVYAMKLRAGASEDYIPFFVRPVKGTTTARIAFLAPTFSYLAYANSRFGTPQLYSLYDKHSDGSGVSYSTRLRPILTLRPKKIPVVAATGLRNPGSAGGFNADLMLLDFMEQKGLAYDVVTDEDLHWEGASLLGGYKVVVSGAHPEYWSSQMLDGLKTYLENGGRFMYLGGNGFYWITSMDPEERHTIEVRRRDGTETWEAAPGEYFHSTTGEFGGLWRFRGRPPQVLVGVGFSAQGGGRGVPFRRTPGSFDPRASWMFDGIGVTELIGDHPSLSLEYGAAGHEVDRLDYMLGSPPHALVVATTLTMSDHYQHVIEEVLQSNSLQGGTVNPYVRGDIVYFEYPKGGAMFSTSSIAWNGSLSYNNYTNAVARLTENVLRRFSSDTPPRQTDSPQP